MPPDDGSHVAKIVIDGDAIEAHGSLDVNWDRCLALTILVTQRNGAVAQGAGAPTISNNKNADDEWVWSLTLQQADGTPALAAGRKAHARAVGAMDSAGQVEVVRWTSNSVPVNHPQ
jgi:hypothetical protein